MADYAALIRPTRSIAHVPCAAWRICLKGFPNQVAELPRIAAGVQCLVEIAAQGKNGKDHAIFGEALLRAGVAGTGHTKAGKKPIPVDLYLKAQSTKPASYQSHQTTAR